MNRREINKIIEKLSKLGFFKECFLHNKSGGYLMKKIKQLALLTTCMACNPMIVFADEYRMDKQLLTAILYFLQMCSSVFFALGIGMLIWSVQSEDGAKKTGAIKIIGVGLLLLVLGRVAKAGALI